MVVQEIEAQMTQLDFFIKHFDESLAREKPQKEKLRGSVAATLEHAMSRAVDGVDKIKKLVEERVRAAVVWLTPPWMPVVVMICAL